MPYAAKATITHEFDTDHLNVFVEFACRMRLSSNPLATPKVNDRKPPHELWTPRLDGSNREVETSEWLDTYTLKLTVVNIVSLPAKLQLKYSGPSPMLESCRRKQWEPWGYIVSKNVTT